MPWTSSDRRKHLPRNWSTIRLAVFKRDGYQCRIHGQSCTWLATEVDHIGDRDDHRLENLQAVCHRCHAGKTAFEAAEAQRATRARGRRPPEPHPGATTPGGDPLEPPSR